MSDRQSASDCQVVSRRKISDENNTALSEYSQARKKDRNSLNVAILVKNIIATLTVDNESNRFEQMDVTTLACDGVAFTLEKHDVFIKLLYLAFTSIENFNMFFFL